MYHILLTTIFLCIGNTIVAMEDMLSATKQDNKVDTEQELKLNELRKKVYPLIATYYNKNHLPFSLNQTKIPSTTQLKDTAFWVNDFQEMSALEPSYRHMELHTKEEWLITTENPSLRWIFYVYKTKQKHPRQKESSTIQSFVHIFSEKHTKNYWGNPYLGTLFFTNAKYLTFSDNQKKLITLDTKKSNTQTEYDLTPFFNDVNAIYAMSDYEVYKLAACENEVKDSEKKDRLVKIIMDKFLQNTVKREAEKKDGHLSKKQKTF